MYGVVRGATFGTPCSPGGERNRTLASSRSTTCRVTPTYVLNGVVDDPQGFYAEAGQRAT